MKFRHNIKWVLIFLLLIIICLCILLLRKPPSSPIAQIIQNGTVIREISLSSASEPYEFTVTSPNGGQNTIRVENGKIGIAEASCPDKICVNRGFTDSAIPPIVCLPNKLSVIIRSGTSDVDAVTGGIMP